MSDEHDDAARRAADLQDRTVVGGAPIGGGSSTVGSGAFDTAGGGDLGGEGTRAPGFRDPGDAAGDLRPESAAKDTEGQASASALERREAEQLAAEVFGDDAAQAGSGDDGR